jgi:ribosomal protein L7Ae-like RNA K-turn-binding protein
MNNKFLQFLGIVKKSGKITEGYNKCEEIIKKGMAKLIILSDDASSNTRNKFENYSTRYDVPIIKNGFLSEDLGKILGREKVKVLCVVDYKMSCKLISILDQND